MDVSELLVPVQVGAAVVKLTRVVAAARTKDLMATMLIDGFEGSFRVCRRKGGREMYVKELLWVGSDEDVVRDRGKRELMGGGSE
jgi:hypothetical protein